MLFDDGVLLAWPAHKVAASATVTRIAQRPGDKRQASQNVFLCIACFEMKIIELPTGASITVAALLLRLPLCKSPWTSRLRCGADSGSIGFVPSGQAPWLASRADQLQALKRKYWKKILTIRRS